VIAGHTRTGTNPSRKSFKHICLSSSSCGRAYADILETSNNTITTGTRPARTISETNKSFCDAKPLQRLGWTELRVGRLGVYGARRAGREVSRSSGLVDVPCGGGVGACLGRWGGRLRGPAMLRLGRMWPTARRPAVLHGPTAGSAGRWCRRLRAVGRGIMAAVSAGTGYGRWAPECPCHISGRACR